MKKILFLSVYLLLAWSMITANAQTTFTLNPLYSFGSRGDGSIQPGDSIGTSPTTGNNVQISAQGGFGIQPGDSIAAPISTNGFNMRGLSYDPISGNLVFVDTHTGSGGSTTTPTNAAIYILDRDSGNIIGALNTNGIVGGGGVGTFVAAGVAEDGAVYVANQINTSTVNAFKIYRWPTANTNAPNFNEPPTVAFTNVLSPAERLGQTMDVRGAGPNTQIIIGSSAVQSGQPGTNIFLFTTVDGTNFTSHQLNNPGVTIASFNDGIAFGSGNTFFTKQVGKPLYFFGFDPVTFATTIIATYTASSANDPLLNLSAIAVDNVNQLFAGLEQIGGTANGGRGRVWLYNFSDPTNKAPAILASRTYIPNFVKATAPMGYLDFGGGRLYANVVNNGLLASTIDSIPLGPPVFVQDLPASTRIAVGQTAHFEVTAITAITNYQWYSNNVAIPGATTYFLNVTNVQTNNSGTVYKVIVSNAAGSLPSANSTLTVVSISDFFHLSSIWSVPATTSGATTNYITSNGATTTPKERAIAYHSLSNQLLVVRGVAGTIPTVFVVDANTGTLLYTLKTNGVVGGQNLTLCGIGVADDGAVYAANAATDNSFRIYRWADTGSNTIPQIIFGTNSSAATANPIQDLTGTQQYRFGDNLAVRGAGLSTEIIVDSQNSAKFAAILRPTDGTMTNWTATGYLLQNIQGSYGSEAYGTFIGRSLQFGNGTTFWQKRYNLAAGAPLAQMSYTPGGGLSPLVLANIGLPLFTNGPVGLSFSLKLAAAINFVGAVGSDSASAQDTLDYYDLSEPSQAVLLSRQNLSGGNSGNHKGNQNAIGQVVFAANPLTGSNYLFVINGNNGVSAFVLEGGVTPPPKILSQPKNVRILEGTTGALGVAIDQPATVQWFKGTNPPVDTLVRGNNYPIVNAQPSAAGDYFVIATNINGSVTSQVVHVSIGLTNDNYTLAQAWAASAGDVNYPYVTSNGGANTPNERSFAYNSPSNQLIVVRCPPNSTAYTVWVVDAATGANLYTLNTTGVIHEGPSEVIGANAIDLVAAAGADDGAIYICSVSPNASGGAFGDTTKMLHVFRWANSGPSTVPILVYEGDPSGQPPGINLRWGDVMAARGSGINTELTLNSFEGNFAAVLKPIDSSMTTFTNSWFSDTAGGGSIGRSIQFGTNNTVYEKRKGAPLFHTTYTNQVGTLLSGIDSSPTLGGVAVDATHKLMIGVDFIGNVNTRPDAVALYDISDPSTPMLISQYNFPSNQIANANAICNTIVVGNRVYALDGNNGMVAFNIVDPPLVLNIIRAGSNVNLSWTDSNAILQGTTNLNPTITWTDLSSVGQTNAVQNASSGNQYFRLKK